MRIPFLLIALWFAAALVVTGCDSGSNVPADLGTSTTLSFVTESVTVSEGDGTATLEILVQDAGFKPLQVSVDVVGGTLADDEYSLPTTTVMIPESITSGETVSFTVNVSDDEVYLEGTKTLIVELQPPEGASLGETTIAIVNVEEDDILDPATPIADVRQESLGETVVVRGVVTSRDGSNIFIQDESGTDGASGIVIRDNNLSTDYQDGVINPGDLIQAEGELGAFSGLLQVSGDDLSYILAVPGRGLPDAQTITVSDILNGGGETYESELVTVVDATIDPGGDTEFQDGTNYDFTDASSTGSSAIRIVDNSFYVGETIPSTVVTLRGVLSQFNFGFGGARGPDTGYQLFPVQEGDIQP